MATRKAFTLIELLVVVAVVALLIGLLLPAIGSARTTAQQLLNAGNLRSTQNGMFSFGQDNENLYPGLRALTGEFANDVVPNSEIPQVARINWLRGDSIISRYLILLGGEYVEPENVVSPVELNGIPNANNARRVQYDPSRGMGGDASTSEGYESNDVFWSYAMLQVTADQQGSGKAMLPQLARAWRDDSNAMTPVLSDRVMNFNALPNNQFFPFPNRHDSLWTGPHNIPADAPEEVGSGWVGSVVYNDGHTEFIKQTSVIDNTQFGSSPVNAIDSLFTFDDGFDPETRSDAVFVSHFATTLVIR